MEIKSGSNITVHYKLTVEGDVIEDSFKNDPLTFTFGNKEMIAGFENNLEGLKAGDEKCFSLPPEEAYGQTQEEAIQTMPCSAFADIESLVLGSVVELKSQNETFQAKIIEKNKEDVTLDLNHPLAGKTLTFDVKIVGVK